MQDAEQDPRHHARRPHSGEGAALDPYSGSTAPELVGLGAVQLGELARGKRAAVLTGLVAPLVLVPAYATVLLTWLPRLPNPIATHWSGGGTPDGFSDHTGLLLTTVGSSAGMAVLLGCIAVFGSGKSELAVWSGVNRFVAAASLAMSVSMGLMGVGIAWKQLGLQDARDVGGVGTAVAAAFGVGIVLGAVGFVVQPRVYIGEPNNRAADPVPLGASERAVWVARVRPSKMFLVAIGVTVLVLALGTAAALASAVAAAGAPGGTVAFWTMLAVTLLMVALYTMTFSFRVRIDARGLEARSVVGWPVFRVPASDVERAIASHISPLGEFGGWGLRWAPGRFGIVMRTGEGIVITRKDGRVFALTIDDAETGAGLLEAVARITEATPNDDNQN